MNLGGSLTRQVSAKCSLIHAASLTREEDTMVYFIFISEFDQSDSYLNQDGFARFLHPNCTNMEIYECIWTWK